VISQDDAVAFCLVAAQVIPTLLIAHFVAERTLPPAPPPRWRQALPALAEQAAEARQRLTARRQEIARARARIERRRWWRYVTGRADRHREALAQLDQGSAELDDAAAELDRLDQQRAEQEAQPDYPLIDLWYAKMLAWVMADGLVGESAALLGAFRLHIAGHSLVVLFAAIAATAILLMLGLMAQAALLRFRHEARLRPGPSFLIATLLTLAGTGVLVAVLSSGPAAKPSHSPTPAAKPSASQSRTAEPRGERTPSPAGTRRGT
jgi:hypothetical protein